MARVKRVPGASGGIDKLAALLGGLDAIQGKVGFFESAKYPDGTPAAYVAAIQEFGAPDVSIPPRSFFRTTVAAKTNAWRASLNSGAKQIIAGAWTPEQMMDALVQLAAGNVAQTLAKLQDPPLSPVTLQLRAWKRAGIPVGGKQVGWAASLVAKGLNDQVTGSAAKPLVDSGFLLNAITGVVNDTVVYENKGAR